MLKEDNFTATVDAAAAYEFACSFDDAEEEYDNNDEEFLDDEYVSINEAYYRNEPEEDFLSFWFI